MGSTSSKFKKYLQHGDEFAAMQIYQSSPELRKNLDPNLSYGENHNHNTALHYAAKHGENQFVFLEKVFCVELMILSIVFYFISFIYLCYCFDAFCFRCSLLCF